MTRFEVHDRDATVAAELRRANTWLNPRYWVLDTEAPEGSSRIYDEMTTKRAATNAARDLNAGVYGPLADQQKAAGT